MNFRIILIFVSLILPTVSQAEYPAPRDEYVNDFARIIDNDIQKKIRKSLYDTEYYSGVEIVVVTIDSYERYNTNDENWEEFSTGLFNEWGVGNYPKNDGVMILVSKLDRKIRIELGGGYGPQYDSMMKEIIEDYMVPLLKNDNYTKGIEVGVYKVIDNVTVEVSFFEWYKWYILAGVGALISLGIALAIDKKENAPLFWIMLGMAGFIILSILRGLASGERSEGHGGGSSSGGGASGSF